MGRVPFSHIEEFLTQPFMSWEAFSDQVNYNLGSFERLVWSWVEGAGQSEKDKKDKFKQWQ